MRTTSLLERTAATVLCGICLATGGGCVALKVPSMPSLLEKPEPIVAPKSLAAVWTNAVLQQEGTSSTRGLGGLVTFYDADRKRPVRVDGRLVVYAYEDASRETGGAIPDRKYVFTPEQFETHYGKSPLGPSYSIWIPWDKSGGPQQEINLVVRFDPVEGGPVMSKSTRVALPGTGNARTPSTGGAAAAAAGRSLSTSDPATAAPQPSQAGEIPSDKPAREMTTTTLTLPPRGT